MGNIKQIITSTIEHDWIQAGKEMADMGAVIVDMAQNRLKIEQDKLKTLSNKNFDMSYQYNEIILKHYVPRTIYHYGKNSGNHISIKKIKSKIENHRRPFKNIIITGQAGSGKSTILKWLFLKSNVRNCNFILLYAKMFMECRTLDDILAQISDIVPNDKQSIIFFDGLDELPCINGTEYELQKFINFFDQKSNPLPTKPDCRFIISTRPEHFEFGKMILHNNLEYAIDNYEIFEVSLLTDKESLKICKSIKMLNQYDQEMGYSHFLDKWPAKKDSLITEKEYIKFLKKYLNSTADHSLLKFPLLCRYAYQIIYNWSLQEQEQDNPMGNMGNCLSSLIQQAMESYIKWEFHDNNRKQTQGGTGKQEFEFYKTLVMGYLTEAAGKMGLDDFLPKDQWHLLKNTRQITSLNQAVCALCEDENNNLRFIHQSFKEFFLACYYASLSSEKLVNDKTFYHILKFNANFSIMYIERLLASTNSLAQKICNELLSLNNCTIDRISEYAKGNLRFLFIPSITFTIEEYLTVFPYGHFLYAGITFDRNVFSQLNNQGLIELKNLDIILDYKDSPVFKNKVTGIKIFLPSITFMRSHFWIYADYCFYKIYGYEHIKKEQIESNYQNPKCSLEHNLLFDAMNKIITFIGEEKKFWCLFDGDSLFIYQINSRNEELMNILFHHNFTTNPDPYITLYGMYLAKSNNETSLIQKARFRRVTDVSFNFDTSQFIIQKTDSVLCQYYENHFKLNFFFMKKIQHDYPETFLRKFFECLYKDIFSLIQNISDPKLKLYFYDDLLILLYILEKRQPMVDLSYKTLGLCEQYNHSIGIMLRNFFIYDDGCFLSNNMEKLQKLMQDYIWI